MEWQGELKIIILWQWDLEIFVLETTQALTLFKTSKFEFIKHSAELKNTTHKQRD